MAWLKAKKDLTLGTSLWVPKNAGDALEGEYMDTAPKKNGKNLLWYLRIRDQTGIRLVQHYRIIRAQFDDLKVQPHEKIKIVYLGGNNKRKDFDIFVDRPTHAVVVAGRK